MKLTILFLLVYSFSFAQNNEIIGVSRTNVPSNQVYLAKVNEITGLIQDLSTSSYSEYISNFTYTVDPDLDIFYYTGNNNLIGIDINSGNLITDVPITTSLQPYFQNFVYNEITQELIGLERGQNGGNQVFLSKIDPQTGVVTPISQTSITDVITLNGGSTIDLNNQWFQFVSNGQLLSVDITTGQVVHSPAIDTSQVAFFDNILFNASDGNLYGLGRNSNPAEIFLGQIDPITGVVTLISQQSLTTAFSLSGAAINPFTGVYYFKGLNNFIGVSTINGNIVSSTPLDFSQSNGDYFDYYYFSGRVITLLNSRDAEFDHDIKIYPNPVESILSVKLNNINKIQIYNLLGKPLYEESTINAGTFSLDMTEYPSGIYLIKFTTPGNSFVKKIIRK
jgi:hypothetical protein